MANKDDLLNIGNGNTQNNMKKILIYVAIAFLVFVIGVIGFAIVQNSNNSEKNAIIPPEVKSQPKQENLFKQIPIENEKTQNTEQNTKQNTQKPQNNIKEEIIQNSENKPEEKSEPKKPAVPKKTKEEKKELKPVIEKKPEIKKIEKSHKKALSNKKYYIQVAALLRYKKPSKKFLRLITKNGYKYKFFITYTKLKGERVKVTKVLIGPFSSKKEAKKALKKVKDNITQNAFIFKVK